MGKSPEWYLFIISNVGSIVMLVKYWVFNIRPKRHYLKFFKHNYVDIFENIYGSKTAVVIIFKQSNTKHYFCNKMSTNFVTFSPYSPEKLGVELCFIDIPKNNYRLIPLKHFKLLYIFVLYFQVVLRVVGNYIAGKNFYGYRY